MNILTVLIDDTAYCQFVSWTIAAIANLIYGSANKSLRFFFSLCANVYQHCYLVCIDVLHHQTSLANCGLGIETASTSTRAVLARLSGVVLA